MPLQWVQTTTAAPWAGRTGHSVVITPDGRIWILGGYTSAGYKNDVWYSTDGSTWTQATAAASWAARVYHTSAVTSDGRIWVIGGYGGSNLNDVWYSSDGISWTQATSSASWVARSGHTSVVTPDGKIWVIGGWDGSAYRNDVWYSTNGSSWTQATYSAAWDGRAYHASAVTPDGRIWVIAGYYVGSGGTTYYYSDVWYSTNGVSWTQAASWRVRGLHAAAVTADGKLWVLGGSYNGTYYNDVWYTADGSSWIQDTSAALWAARSGHKAVASGNNIYVLGGSTGSTYLNDVWCGLPEGTTHNVTGSTMQIVSNAATLTGATRQTVSNPATLTGAVKLIVEEKGVQRTFGIPVVNHRGHHIINGTITTYGRPPDLFGEAIISDYTAASVEYEFPCFIAVSTPATLAGATRQVVSAEVEFSFGTTQSVCNPVASTYTTRQEIGTRVEWPFASYTTIHNPVASTGATRQEVGAKVEFSFGTTQSVGSPAVSTYATRQEIRTEVWLTLGTAQAIGNPVTSAYAARQAIGSSRETLAGVKLEIGSPVASTFATSIDILLVRPVEYLCSTQLSVSNTRINKLAVELEVNNPVVLQASTRQSVSNNTYYTFNSAQLIYARVSYTAATEQRILSVSPYATSFAVKLTVNTPLVSLFVTQVETVPTGKGEGTLEFTVIPADANACTDITWGECLIIERPPGQVKATYRGPDGPVELIASCAWQTGQELPVAFRWSRAGCALFVGGVKQVEDGAPLLTGEQIASINTGAAQYSNIRVSVRAREDWEIEQAAKAKLWPQDQDTLCLIPTPSDRQVQHLSPTVFPAGTVTRFALPYKGLYYALYEGETGWLKLDYDDSSWDKAIQTYYEGIYSVYIWAPAGDGSAAHGTIYYRQPFYLDSPWERISLNCESRYARFKAYLNGVLVVDGTQPDYRYNYQCWVGYGPLKYGLNLLCFQAEATGTGTPGLWYNMYKFSGIASEMLAWSDTGDIILGYRRPLWGAWKEVSSQTLTLPAGKAVRFRSTNPASVKFLNWKDEDESFVRMNITPVVP
ncbi:Kelch repeat type 1-containing protein [Desulfofundulus kuznetsovii DSM 6115]|uniref:Kelch repeat type 1-containing protein n=1 Tax=Desulfofundulus kuznetsovii (strain DSM 6115 / VKM B-1805 / 17) TaxID=760568 RepID=A0AAU8PBW9_DESK7|nr:Kelch repeat type 1-containing protein [Desulfofundulus kuznetsovii DSM 6115]